VACRQWEESPGLYREAEKNAAVKVGQPGMEGGDVEGQVLLRSGVSRTELVCVDIIRVREMTHFFSG
jgi:hypothetical protein